ncbi:DNA mismatch repair protein MutS [Natronomonas pharaonis DSM 2160]|uniref:DNA-binding protein MutS2 n=1 Tax=Natronomonas pharaonis (strain ATCC 35678 / DSM 2160 / CIP 103997 / JCM 8858 / NBRC 14720 / NCIMB 2260 / Gabara) TaxID=348780 RepID=A0A1U7ETW5_NATPD|nr:helix-hairpin-helix domain-containing protein [Natronomonas pharaonis]CAI48384.1 DNA mismatch repair protein MutS [Natronomonas pharaonis DSM 2160]
MEFEELEAIPGVGEKTAERLAELDDPEAALSAGDVATIARAPGISDGRAARIARAAIRHRHDDDGTFLASERAQELYASALSLLQERAVTDYAEKRLETFYPSASASRIEEVRSFAREAVKQEPTPELLDALEGVEPLSPPRDVRVRDRCVATSDAETFAEAQEAVPEVSVELVEDARGVADLARGYATVIVLDESFSGIDVEGDVRVEPTALESPAEIVPERTLAFFAENRDRLRAAAAVNRLAGTEPDCDVETLDAALERLDADGSVSGDKRVAALNAAIEDLDAAVSMAEGVANDRLRSAIEERDVTIEGTDLLSLVERGAGVDSLLERELADEFDAAVEAAREEFVGTIGLDDYESLARRAFGEEPTFPVEHDERVVERLREELTADRDRRAARLKREVAADLREMREAAAALVETALELDVELAVSRFARDFDCTFPEFDGKGFEITGGRSPLLDVEFEAVEPVDYGVEGVALLSGVNSGGKTSTLDLVGLVVVLGQMGLPVPAESARLERFEALHYQAKTQGTLDAGAFESTLREFGSLVAGDRTRLVLVDELESITEPGASAVIIAGILEALEESDSTAVFVSHLAGEIREATAVDVTVDGIEAVGLKNGELQVNRSPVKDHLARSTPELIVEKLAEEDGDELYGELLEKFEAEKPAEAD